MKKVLITILTLTLFLSFSYTNAQLQTSIDGVTIASNPESPAPGENVTVSIESYLIDLNSASIVWLSNGSSIASGIGMKEVKIKAPTIGKKVIISAVIKASSGQEIRKAIVVKSGSVDIIWETRGYTPPFFKGKNPLVYQNEVKLTAMPHLSLDGIKEVDPKSLVYEWRSGGKFIEGAVGYGKQSITIKADIVPKPLEIRVNVYTRDQSQGTEKSITIQPTEPSISFYEVNPLYGTLFNKALSSRISLDNSEITVFASPFGFDFKNNSLNYTWSINNVEQPDLSKNQSITLRTKGDVDGSSSIDLDIRHISNILQGARSAFSANFKKKVIEDTSTTF